MGLGWGLRVVVGRVEMELGVHMVGAYRGREFRV